ncbi:MAG: hypothetical protein ACFWUN_05915 [Pseudolactococcus raffinolactis]|jgi:NAD(P)H-flavin reductase
MTKYSFEFNLKVVNVYLSGGYRFLTEKYHVKDRKKIHHWVNTYKEFDTDMLKQCIDEGADYDLVIAIGSIIMMKMVSQLTKTYGIKTIVSMNPVMVAGTGMCGGDASQLMVKLNLHVLMDQILMGIKLILMRP